MNRIDLEREYWDKAALDPDVDEKYISDISTEEMIEALEIPDKASYFLDIGCGVGRIANSLANKSRKIYGVDISREMIRIADDRKTFQHMVFWVNDGRTIPKLTEGIIDFAYSMLLFQHLPQEAIRSYISETRRVLKHGGIFRFQFIEGTEQEPFSNHYSLEDIKLWLEDAGLEFVKADKGLCHFQWTWVTARKPYA